MKFLHLSPGAGDNFYCENCLRDAAMVLALRGLGHDASCLPMYLPPMVDDGVDPALRTEVFFGGVNVYLQQKSALFRKTPRWLDRFFDSPRLLRWAGRKAGMTKAADVGQTLLSMLAGEDGRQVKELDRLVGFLTDHERPDVVSLSNALLLGVVRRIKQAVAPVILCSLQDEEGFVDALDEPQRSQAWAALRERARDMDAFVAPSEFYRDAMSRRLDLPPQRFHVIPNGIDATGLVPAAAPPEPPAVGFLSQMSADKGLPALAEAFCLLKQSGRFADLKLRIFGGMTGADVACVQGVRARLEQAGVSDDVAFAADFDPANKPEFLRSCSVVSVPSRRGESFGLFVLDALACGVPLVLPDHGAFPELIEATGGGRLCKPNDPADLAETLDHLLSDPAAALALGRAGRQAVLEKFDSKQMARRVADLCRDLQAGKEQGPCGG